MSNYTDWERRNSLHPGCAIPLAVMCFACAVLFSYLFVSRLLYDYPDGTWGFILWCAAFVGLFLYVGIAITWRLAKGKPIPYVGQGGEPPPTIETYHFLPEDGKDER